MELAFKRKAKHKTTRTSLRIEVEEEVAALEQLLLHGRHWFGWVG
jgi:16S rRNA C1402 N4-methylase RsmH